MVQMVVCRRRKPPAQPMPGKAARHGFYGQVPMGVAHDLVDGKGKQHQPVQWRHQQRQRRHQAVDQCFDGVERIRRPGRRVARAVVHAVHAAKQPAAVQQAVGPVKVEVVPQQHRRKAERQPQGAVLAGLEVDDHVAAQDAGKHHQALGRENQQRRKRIRHLAPHIGATRPARDHPMGQALVQPFVQHQPQQQGGHQVVQALAHKVVGVSPAKPLPRIRIGPDVHGGIMRRRDVDYMVFAKFCQTLVKCFS